MIDTPEVYVAIADTESGDRYVFVTDHEPTKESIVRQVFEGEGGDEEDYEWYMETTRVDIGHHDVLTPEDLA